MSASATKLYRGLGLRVSDECVCLIRCIAMYKFPYEVMRVPPLFYYIEPPLCPQHLKGALS